MTSTVISLMDCVKHMDVSQFPVRTNSSVLSMTETPSVNIVLPNTVSVPQFIYRARVLKSVKITAFRQEISRPQPGIDPANPAHRIDVLQIGVRTETSVILMTPYHHFKIRIKYM
jgi:hypothetical protein